jgi:hypothetical protein
MGSNQVSGRVIHIDRFGNAITNVGERLFRDLVQKKDFIIEIKRVRLQTLKSNYQEGHKGETIALFGSSRLLEISVNGGNAAEQHRIVTGDSVGVHIV